MNPLNDRKLPPLPRSTTSSVPWGFVLLCRNPEEQHQEEVVRERTAISAHVVYHAVLAEGEEELKRPTSALAFSGLAAGLSMGFSFLTQGLLQANLPDRQWTLLVAKLGYAMGS